jgi:hypothetical protein
MSKLRVFWGWLLPGLMCLDPAGAIAYYSAGAGSEAPRPEPSRARQLASVSDAVRSAATIIPLARL